MQLNEVHKPWYNSSRDGINFDHGFRETMKKLMKEDLRIKGKVGFENYRRMPPEGVVQTSHDHIYHSFLTREIQFLAFPSLAEVLLYSLPTTLSPFILKANKLTSELTGVFWKPIDHSCIHWLISF